MLCLWVFLDFDCLILVQSETVLFDALKFKETSIDAYFCEILKVGNTSAVRFFMLISGVDSTQIYRRGEIKKKMLGIKKFKFLKSKIKIRKLSYIIY